MQTTVLLRSARILRRVLETWEELLSLRKPLANFGEKNSQMSKKNYYGAYLHGNGLFRLNIYPLYLTLGEIISKQTGRRWAGTHFGWPRFIGGRIWSAVSWFQWQSVEVRFDRHPWASGGHPPPGSNPSLGEYRRGPRHSGACRACLGPSPGPT